LLLRGIVFQFKKIHPSGACTKGKAEPHAHLK